jgi:hypothetical protein
VNLLLESATTKSPRALISLANYDSGIESGNAFSGSKSQENRHPTAQRAAVAARGDSFILFAPARYAECDTRAKFP